MIPDPEEMLDVAYALEVEAHRHGWDKQATLGYVGCTDSTVAIEPSPVQPTDVPAKSIYESLMMIAAAMNTWDMASDHVLDVTAGVFLISEAWSLLPELRIEGREIADTPGAQEMRTCALVDCGGWLHLATRIRGEEPKGYSWGPGEWPPGRIAKALRSILLVLGKQMSPGMLDVEALRRRA